MSFINKRFRIYLFLPEGVIIDIENIRRASDVSEVKWKKDSKDS
jgi:hypothetical protein